MPIRPHVPLKRLPIDLETVDTSKGSWLVAVASIVETIGDGNLLLKLILEQRIDDKRFRMRQVGIKVKAVDARDANRSAPLLDRIRNWIESSEGDGFIDAVG